MSTAGEILRRAAEIRAGAEYCDDPAALVLAADGMPNTALKEAIRYFDLCSTVTAWTGVRHVSLRGRFDSDEHAVLAFCLAAAMADDP
ncbi:MAG: hypothetical protein AB7G13_28700 [Lautropia sp.]